MIMDIGLGKKDRKLVCDSLTRVLADTFALYMKAHSFHWNVTGPHFKQFHDLFQGIYEDLNEKGDGIAERMRALGLFAPASFQEFSGLSAIKDEKSIPEALDMVRQLTMDMELLIRRLQEVLEIAESVKDDGTADLLVEHIRDHGKTAWILRSHLE